MKLATDSAAAKQATEESGIATLQADTVDEAVRRVATEIVTLEGMWKQVRPRGGGSMYAPQTIGIHPESRGNGVMLSIPGWGDANPEGGVTTIQRVVMGDSDFFQTFKVNRATMQSMSWTHNDTLDIDGLTINVPCAAGASTFLEATACVEVHAESAASAIELMIVIGNDNETPGKHSTRLIDAGAFGEPFQTGGDTAWHSPVFEHGRLIIGNEATAGGGVVVTVRARRFAAGSGSAPPPNQTPAKFVPGDTFRCISNEGNVNIRAAANTGSAINGTMAHGANGTIGSAPAGPFSGSGYKWWKISAPIAGYVAEQFLQKTTPTAPPTAPATNQIRSGWLKVRRMPI